MPKRRIAVVTGTRAEYGLFIPVLNALAKRKNVELQLFVTGMHLVRRFGYTVKQIESDSWNITAKVRFQSSDDDIIGQSVAFGRAITKFSQEFSRHNTDIVVVLGDRIEAFAAAAAAAAGHRILAHIHGGDVATGVQDDAWRYAITQLAHLHFAASKGACQRIAACGEQPFRIYQTGSPALDDIDQIICRDPSVLSKGLGFDVCNDYMTVIQHPAGAQAAQERQRMLQTLRASAHFKIPLAVIYPNCDPGFSGIIEAAASFCRDNKCILLRNLPRDVYLGLLSRTRVLVGNSSSGIIEAGYLAVPCVNIGQRQKGRERSPNVIDVPYGTKHVTEGIARALKRKKYRRSRLYGDGRSSERIAGILARTPLNQRLRQKQKFQSRS